MFARWALSVVLVDQILGNVRRNFCVIYLVARMLVGASYWLSGGFGLRRTRLWTDGTVSDGRITVRAFAGDERSIVLAGALIG